MIRIKCMIAIIAVITVMSTSIIAGTLEQCEKLTETEKAMLSAAKAEVVKAEAKVDVIKLNIAKAHKFHAESWMEWETWVEFNGILFCCIAGLLCSH